MGNSKATTVAIELSNGHRLQVLEQEHESPMWETKLEKTLTAVFRSPTPLSKEGYML